MSGLIDRIDKNNLPNHVAVIMDGNGRWAKQHGKPRVFGHQNGVQSVREVSEAAAELGVSYLTLYAFSRENWKRPRPEVNALMHLLIDTVRKEVNTLCENNIRLSAIGELSSLPNSTYKALLEGIEKTRENTRMVLTLALNYSARAEITQAAKAMARDISKGIYDESQITEDIFESYLQTADMPDPELLIRTSGEKRISNYLLWQIAYTEFYFAEVYWPDFRKDHFYQAIIDYQSRERRFGKISEQIAT